MIKRIITILMVVLLLTPTATVYADVVSGNDFFDKKETKAEKIGDESYGKSFFVNGPSGYASFKEAPGSSKEVRKYENGSIIYIAYVYKHMGEYWGIPAMTHGPSPGWVLMDELLAYYDNSDFRNEHKSELYNYTGGFDELRTSEEFYIWQWPGSDREKIHYIVYDYSELDYEYAIRARHAYTDNDGREWAYVVLWEGNSGGLSHIGSAEGWVCLSDFNNDKIPAFNPAPPPAKWSHDSTDRPPDGALSPPDNTSEIPIVTPEPIHKNGFNITLVIIALVVVFVAGTAVAIWILLKKNKTKS